MQEVLQCHTNQFQDHVISYLNMSDGQWERSRNFELLEP